jgi:hypothetical protein
MQRIFRKQPRAVYAILILTAIAACGDTLGKQALIGGGVGLGTAAVLDGNLAAGAAVGAAGNVAYCQAFPDRCN